MKRAGFELSEDEFKMLVAWGKVRNAISHAPPEEYRPAEIVESDLVEYISFLKTLCARWRDAMNAV